MARTYGKAQDLIDFTRASSGTALRRVKYGVELVTNGTFDSDLSGWNIDGVDATHTITFENGGARYQSDTTSPVLSLSQPNIMNSVKIYQLSVVVSNYVSGALKIDTANGAVLINGNGTFTYNISPVSSGYLSLYRATANVDMIIQSVSVKEVTFDTSDGDLVLFNHPNNIPRIEYDADGNLLGLLVEEQRVNNIAYSNFNSGWGETTFSGISSSGLRYLQLNAGMAPDGTNTAVKAYASTNLDQQRLYYSTGLANAQYTFSFYAKAAEYTKIAIRHDTGNGELISVDLTDGSLIGTTTPEAYSITDVGNGWYRISITDTDTDASGVPWVQLLNNLGQESFAGDGVSGVYIWGPQAEAGSFPTSYIPTSGSTATRSADVASLSTSAFGYNQDHFTLAIDVKCKGRDAGDYPRLWALLVSGGQSMSLWYSDTRFYLDKATVGPVFTLTENSLIQNKIGVSYDSDSVKICVNGETVSESATSFATNAPTLYIGDTGAGNSYGSFYLKSLKYLPRFITNAQLQELTL